MYKHVLTCFLVHGTLYDINLIKNVTVTEFWHKIKCTYVSTKTGNFSMKEQTQTDIQ